MCPPCSSLVPALPSVDFNSSCSLRITLCKLSGITSPAVTALTAARNSSNRPLLIKGDCCRWWWRSCWPSGSLPSCWSQPRSAFTRWVFTSPAGDAPPRAVLSVLLMVGETQAWELLFPDIISPAGDTERSDEAELGCTTRAGITSPIARSKARWPATKFVVVGWGKERTHKSIDQKKYFWVK